MMIIIIFFLYVPILLSLCLSFLLHVFKKHIHLFLLDFVTAFNSTNTMIHNYKLHPKSSTTTTVRMHVLEDSPPPLKQIGFIDNVVEGVTETLGFNIQSIDIKEEIDDDDDNDNNNDDDCWSRENFPPPLPSLNENGQPSFILVPVRKNGRLQLSKVRMKRPKIIYSMRQDGRLRLFLAPDQCVDEDSVEEEEVAVEEKMEEEEEEEEMAVKSMEEEEDGDEVVEEISNYEETAVKVGEWKFPNERFRKCHEVMNRIQYHHHHAHRSHDHHLHMYGFGIA